MSHQTVKVQSCHLNLEGFHETLQKRKVEIPKQLLTFLPCFLILGLFLIYFRKNGGKDTLLVCRAKGWTRYEFGSSDALRCSISVKSLSRRFYAVLRGKKFLTLGNLECDVSRDGHKCAGKHIIPPWCKMYVLRSILVCKLTYWCL